MAKCDVCAKSTLLPERFGTVNVCRLCFIKANGPLWKRSYERYDDAEKHRLWALEKMQKHNFPKPATVAVNEFFTSQMNAMLRCDCCGHPVQHLRAIGKANICKQCFEKINTSAWKETEYEDNEAVEKNRQKMLKLASKKGFPPIVVDGINAHFDAKLQPGLVCSVDGGLGQRLKVYETQCQLITKDSFHTKKITEAYIAALQADVAAVPDTASRETCLFKVAKGDFKIDYTVYSDAHYQQCGSNDLGYIRLICSDADGRRSEDIVFFFKSDDKKIDAAYRAIARGIERSKSAADEAPTAPNPPAPARSAADEILKFKNLLDIGAITQDEFDEKKAELLKQ